MAIADVYIGQCRKPYYYDAESLVLEGNAICIIKEATSEREVNEIILRFRNLFTIIKTNKGEKIKWIELLVLNCTCDNLKKIHKKHIGTGTTKPFQIHRLTIPAICMQMTKAEPTIYANVITANR